MNVRAIIILVVTIFVISPIFGQTDEDKTGDFLGTIYFDAFSALGEENNSTAMEIQRIYFGYNYHYNSEITAIFKLDIGSPENESAYSLIRRYAYFRNGGLRYTKKNFVLSVGLIDGLMFKEQESFWGHRYIERSFMDRFRFGPSADIGLNLVYKYKDFTFDGGVYNGEGYKNLQFDNSYRTGLGMTYKYKKKIVFRTHIDYSEKTTRRITYSGFLGYKFKEKFNIGGDYNYQVNYNFNEGFDLFGYSLYGSWNLTERLQYFARYDMLNSNIIDNETAPWDLAADGSSIITGVQWKIVNGILVALNYQDWVPYASNLANRKYLYLNLEVKF
jgi:hypothetical protein